MGIVSRVNSVLNSKSTGMFLFGFTGTYKVVNDYQKAPKHEKKNVLIRDTAILGGSAAGLVAYSLGRKNFINSPFKKHAEKLTIQCIDKIKNSNIWKSKYNILRQPIKFITKNSYNIVKDSIDSSLVLISGVLGGVTTDYLLNIGHTHKNYINQKIEKKSNQIVQETIEQTKQDKKQKDLLNPFNKFKKNMPDDFKNLDNMINEDTKKNIISNIYNMPEMKMFNNSFIGLQSFRIAEEKTFKDKLKCTTKSLLKDTLVPVFFLSLSSSVTKGMKSIIRVPIIFTTLCLGTMAANKKLTPMMSMFDMSIGHNGDKAGGIDGKIKVVDYNGKALNLVKPSSEEGGAAMDTQMDIMYNFLFGNN